jgi:hypothetical protein
MNSIHGCWGMGDSIPLVQFLSANVVGVGVKFGSFRGGEPTRWDDGTIPRLRNGTNWIGLFGYDLEDF